MKPRVAIATGDPAGIGPEISIKAARDPRVREICEPVLFGDREVLSMHGDVGDLRVAEVKQQRPRLGTIDPEHGRAALAAAEAAIRAALKGEYAAVVGAPHTEAAIHAAGIEFDGYPSFVARVTGLAPDDGILMLCLRHEEREIRIAHVTLHTSVARALQLITTQRVMKTIRATHSALVALGIAAPRIAVSGVNPHAGEGGAFGREEIDIVQPAIEAARREMTVDGPIGADTLIQRLGYDAYIVMLHDQGHVAAKLLAPQRVAALTIGTPVLFSSVGHGSALDIAGLGRANPDAVIEAITRLVGRRRRAAAT
ncbi:MAG TPA: 4-hydroxythreonine-4-phosphate dehydrogenase PdxA [Burkholderiales bacterium]|nr:4-hydroxythreonine-4-phosphate dehydrogenase PdxA [Burkholderiales bacterium]